MTEFYDLPKELKLSNYEISRAGIVRNKTTKRSFTCKPKASGMVGPRFVLDNGTKKNYYVHRLVAKTFIPNPDNKKYVHHINVKLSDNRVENLQWVSTTGKKDSGVKLKGRPVYQMKDGKIIKKWDQVTEAGKGLNWFPAYIGQACMTGEEYKGYTFMYVDEHDLIDGEEWKTINIDKFTVNVSNMGRIRNKYGCTYGSGQDNYYKRIKINFKGKSTTIAVHRLVAKAFVPNPDNKEFVNHKDGNKINNKADNLEWVTISENVKHAIDTGLRDFNSMTDALGVKIIQKDLKGNFIAEHKSIAEAAKATGLSKGNICMVCKGKRNKTGGFVFSYKK